MGMRSWEAMKKRIGSMVTGLGVVCLLAGGCESSGQGTPPQKQAVVDPDRCQLARASEVFEAAFPGWSWSGLDSERQGAVRGALEKIRQAGPPSWVSLRRARGVTLDAIRAGEVFGAERVAIVVGETEGFEGEGLSLDQGEALVTSARDRVSDRLGRLRFREAKDEREEARAAAASLGVSPTTQALAEFSQLFEAPLVVSLSAKVRFVPLAGDPEVLGHLEGRGSALVYHRGSGTVLARIQVRSSSPKALGSNEGLALAADGVAREVGEDLAQQVATRLFERLYANK
jgi:hypothetical protein